ncbi:MAG: prolyl oligopeptidase family serine peptidase [Sphingobacteriaceae bacterium]|nr:prolyl oligopeptidase family serine peptidase [Sphingobacteriaceae bacterium]
MIKKHFSIPGASGKPILIDLTSTEQANSPLVIFAHGFKGFKDWGTHHLVANYFAEQDFSFLKFNFSHNGISKAEGDVFDDLEGFANNTFSKELFDINQVISNAISGERFTKPSTVFLIGHSLGGAISIIETAQNKSINKLVTWASISSFRNLWSPAQEQEWRNKGVLYFANSRTNQQMPIYSNLLDDLDQNSDKLDILSAAGSVSQPWLIIHGKADTSVSIDHASSLNRQQTQSRLLAIPDTDHVFSAKHPWTEENLPKPLKHACDATIAFFKEPD